MIEQGVVKEVLANCQAKVIFAGGAKCIKCGACLRQGNEVFCIAENSIDAVAGDRVVVEIAQKKVALAALLLFFLPVLGLIFGYLFAGFLGSFALFVLSFLLIFFMDKFIFSRHPSARIIGRLPI